MKKAFSPMEKLVWLVFALAGCLVLLLFLGRMAQAAGAPVSADSVWHAATAWSALFGILSVTVAAFAALAAVAVYFSVRNQVREARGCLKKLKRIVREYEQKAAEYQQQSQVREQADEARIALSRQTALMAAYGTPEDEGSLAAAQALLDAPETDFAVRLQAGATVRAAALAERLREAEAEPSAQDWTALQAACAENAAVWQLLFQAAAPSEQDSARARYAAALSACAAAFERCGNHRKTQGDTAAALSAWQEAGGYFERILSLQPEAHQAAYRWSKVLGRQADVLTAANLPEARELWQRAGVQLARALAVQPDFYEAAYHWGSLLDDEAAALAESGNLPEAREKWRQAGEQYARVLSLKEDVYAALYNWGNLLDDEATALAAAGNLTEARELWRQAGEKFERVIDMADDFHQAAYNWALALSKEAAALAATDDGLPEARELWQQAGEQYCQALVIRPDFAVAADNRFVALKQEAHYLDGGDLREHWQQAHVQITALQSVLPPSADAEPVAGLLVKINKKVQELEADTDD